MRRMIGAVTIALLAVGGCASSTQLERRAQSHQLRAQAAMESKDYNRAEAERSEAAKLHDQAVKRAFKEGNGGNVTFHSNPY